MTLDIQAATVVPDGVDPDHWSALCTADAVLAHVEVRNAPGFHIRATVEELVLPACGGSHTRRNQLVHTALFSDVSVTQTWLTLREEWAAADRQATDSQLLRVTLAGVKPADKVRLVECRDGDYELWMIKGGSQCGVTKMIVPCGEIASLVRQYLNHHGDTPS